MDEDNGSSRRSSFCNSHEQQKQQCLIRGKDWKPKRAFLDLLLFKFVTLENNDDDDDDDDDEEEDKENRNCSPDTNQFVSNYPIHSSSNDTNTHITCLGDACCNPIGIADDDTNHSNAQHQHGKGQKKIVGYYSGPISKRNGVPNGFGIMKYMNDNMAEQIYKGNIKNGIREGYGTNVWLKDGQVYIGQWYFNLRHGRGKHSWPDGRSVTGQWVDDDLNGNVVFSWPCGALYDGECRAGKRHGKGVQMWPNGNVYSGYYVNDQQNGFGTLVIPCRGEYRGQFLNGKRHGVGVQSWNHKTYDGEWEHDKPHGKGKVTWANQETAYNGEFKNGKYHGYGLYIWSSKKKYIGEWVNGHKEGHGIHTWPSGQLYDGNYKHGYKHGYGKMIWPNGNVYCGYWRFDKRQGHGIQQQKPIKNDGNGSLRHCDLLESSIPYKTMLAMKEEDLHENNKAINVLHSQQQSDDEEQIKMHNADFHKEKEVRIRSRHNQNICHNLHQNMPKLIKNDPVVATPVSEVWQNKKSPAIITPTNHIKNQNKNNEPTNRSRLSEFDESNEIYFKNERVGHLINLNSNYIHLGHHYYNNINLIEPFTTQEDLSSIMIDHEEDQ